MLMDHKENQSPAQERKHNQLAELIRITWGFAKDFSVNEVRIGITDKLYKQITALNALLLIC